MDLAILTKQENPKANEILPLTLANVSSSNEPLQKYRRFSCCTMQRQLASRTALTDLNSSDPFSTRLFGGICLADISGFTRLSARLTAEALKVHINEYFVMLLTVIRRNHGDVIKFLGDAVLILWPVDPDASEEIRSAATTMACLCALQLLKDCGNYDRGEGENKVELRLHCGVVCGHVHSLCVGEADRWEYIISGEPLKAVGEAESEATTGECCLSKEAYARVSEHFEAVEMPKGSYRLTGLLKPTSYISTRFAEETRRQQSVTLGVRPSHRLFSNQSTPSTDSLEKLLLRPKTPTTAVSSKSSEQSTPMSARQLESASRSKRITYLSQNSDSSVVLSPYNSQNIEINLLVTATSPKNTSTAPLSETGNEVLRSSISMSQGLFGASILNLVGSMTQMQSPLPHSSRNVYVKAAPTLVQDPFELIRSLLYDDSYEAVRGYLEGFLAVDDDETPNFVFADPNFAPVLPRFVHHAARAAIENGTDEYLPELRNVVTIFVEILDMDEDLNQGLLDRPQAALSTMLYILKQFEGSLRQFVVDDKGCVMIAAFGLPDSSHEDNCVRAVEVAVALRPRFKKLGIKCRIGISEGRVYCGVVGCMTDRCEYAMMGVSVNLAARLMGKCEVDDILVSETVHDVAKTIFVFQALDKVEAKGFARPVGVFRPVERSDDCCTIGTDDFIGRLDELRLFSTGLNRLIDMPTEKSTLMLLASGASPSRFLTNNPQAFIVQGGPGVGKSRLISEVFKLAKERKLPINPIHARATMGHIQSPFHVIRQLLEGIFNLQTLKKLTVDRSFRRSSRSVHKHSRPSSESLRGPRRRSLQFPVDAASAMRKSEASKGSIDSPPSISARAGAGAEATPAKPRMIPAQFLRRGSLQLSFNTTNMPKIAPSKTSADKRPEGLPVSSQFLEMSPNLKRGSVQFPVTPQPAKREGEEAAAMKATPTHRRRSVNGPIDSHRQFQTSNSGLKFSAQSHRSQEQSKFSRRSEDVDRQEVSVNTLVLAWVHTHAEREAELDERYISMMKELIGDFTDAAETKTDIEKSTKSKMDMSQKKVERKGSLKDQLAVERKGSLKDQLAGTIRDSGISPASVDLSHSISMKPVLAAASSKRGGNSLVSRRSAGRSEHYPVFKLTDLVPLLSEALACPFHDNYVTSSLKPSARRLFGGAFILQLLLLAIESGRSIISVSNLQWIDIQSLQILNLLLATMTKGMFIGMRRSDSDVRDVRQAASFTASEQRQRSSMMSTLLDRCCTPINVKPLNVAEVKMMLSKTMGKSLLELHSELLSPHNISKIIARAGGSPFHTYALAKQLRSAVSLKGFTNVDDLPAGAHNIVIARFDSLSNAEQVVLRTAAIIGMKFEEFVLSHTLRSLELDSFVFELSNYLHSLLDHHLIVVDETSTEYLRCYRFADRSVQETIYNLMISTVRERVHGIVGKFIEDTESDDQTRLDDMIHHYVLSNDTEKKLEYLNYAALKAESQHHYADTIKYYNQILLMTTGHEAAELMQVMCRKVVPSEIPPLERAATTPGRRSSIFNVRIGVTVDDSDAEGDPMAVFRTARVPRWIDFGDILKSIHASTAIDRKLTASITPDDLSSWLAHMGMAMKMLGRLPESNNLIQLSLYHANVYTPKAEVLNPQRSSILMNVTSAFKLIFPVTVPLITSEDSLMLYLKMLHTEAVLFTMRGFAEQAMEIVQIGRALMEKHRQYVHKKTSPHSELRPMRDVIYQNQRERMLESQSFCGESFNILAMTASTSFAKVSDRVQGFLNQSDAYDDPRILICRAVVLSGQGEFKAACEWLEAAMDCSLIQFDRHLHHVAIVYRSWSLFLSGCVSEAKLVLDAVLENCVTYAASSLTCVHVWAIELKILVDTAQLNFENAETSWKLVKTAQKKDRWRLGPTTSAVVAFSLVRDGRFDEAEPLATYACRRLAERQQCNVVVGAMLFCAIYAALDICEGGHSKDGPDDYYPKYRKSKAGTAMFQAMTRLGVMSASFPGLTLLHNAIQCRKMRLFPGFKATVLLADLDSKMKSFPEFLFGLAMFHLEKAALCHSLGVSSGSRAVSKQVFRQMGIVPFDNASLSSRRRGSSGSNLSSVLASAAVAASTVIRPDDRRPSADSTMKPKDKVEDQPVDSTLRRKSASRASFGLLEAHVQDEKAA